MNNLILLDDFRKKKRKIFLLKHKAQLERFIARFIDQHLDMDLLRFAFGRVSQEGDFQEESWDYVEFREILAEVIDQAIGRELYQLLKEEAWFDSRLMTRDEVIERCLSDYILTQCNYAML